MLQKSEPNLKRRCSNCLVALVWGGIILTLFVPLYVERDSFYPFSSAKGILFFSGVQLSVAAWAMLVLFRVDYRPKLDFVTIALFSFLLSSLVSSIHGQDPSRNLWSTYERMSGLIMQGHLFAYVLMLSSFLRSEYDWRRFFYISALIASYVSLIGLFDNSGASSIVAALERVHLLPAGLSIISQSGSTLGNTSFMGSYLQINAFFSLFLLLTGKGRSGILAGFLVVVISAGVFLNPGGRAMKGSFFLAIVCLVIFGSLLFAGSPRVRRAAHALLFAAVPLAVIGAMFVSFAGNILFSGVMDVRGVSERIILWEVAAKGFFEKPIFGWGPENFDLMFYRNFDPAVLVGPGRRIGPPWFDRAHNIVFDLLVTVGIFGFVSYISAMAVSLIALGRGSLRANPNARTGFVVFTALFLAHFLQNLTVFDSISSQMLLYASFAYASNHSAEIRFGTLSFGFRGPSGKSRIPLVVSVFCLSILLFAYWQCVHAPRAVARLVGALEEKIDEDDLLGDYHTISHSVRIGEIQVRVRLAEIAALRLNAAANAAVGKMRLREVDYVHGELEESATESPTNFQIPFTAGRLCATASIWSFENFGGEGEAGEPSLRYVNSAIAAYRKSLEICPNHALAYFELSRALVYKGYISGDRAYFQNALELAESSIKLEPELFASHDLAVDIAANLLEDRPQARELADRAVQINPSWKGALNKRVRESDR